MACACKTKGSCTGGSCKTKTLAGAATKPVFACPVPAITDEQVAASSFFEKLHWNAMGCLTMEQQKVVHGCIFRRVVLALLIIGLIVFWMRAR